MTAGKLTLAALVLASGIPAPASPPAPALLNVGASAAPPS
jgi:hypothetical protein